MDAIKTIMSRRSIRKYSDKRVSEEQIKTILEAAMAAPSAKNEQPWYFIVIKNKKLLNEISEILPNAHMAKDASVAIVVCADLVLEQSKGRAVQDCCISAENILLAAHALGLGAVWTAVYPDEKRVENAITLLKFPENVIPLCIIPIGFPAEEKIPENRFKEERIHFEKW